MDEAIISSDHIEECPQKHDASAECQCELNGVFCICIVCRRPYSKSEVDNMETCPECGVGVKPMLPRENVSINVNWAELKILSNWAEAYALAYQVHYPDMLKAVYSITNEIEQQNPLKTPLTTGRELGVMKEKNPLMPIQGGLVPVMPRWRLQ